MCPALQLPGRGLFPLPAIGGTIKLVVTVSPTALRAARVERCTVCPLLDP
jgi:hypothetical protein